MQSNMNDFGWSFCVCPPHAIKSWFSSCHISDTVTKSNFIWDVCVYFELWSLKYSGEMIKNQQHHRLQQTLQIILLGPCTQPPPVSSSSIHLFPGRTPLPLLPKAASMEWAWLRDITLTPVSVGWGRGEWGREETQHERGVSYTRQARAAFKRLIVL